MSDELSFDNLVAEIAGVPPEAADRVDEQLRFIQEAFSRLESRLAELPLRERHAVQVVLCHKIKRVLCHLQLHVEGTIASQKVLRAVRLDQVLEAKADFEAAGRGLAKSYGLFG